MSFYTNPRVRIPAPLNITTIGALLILRRARETPLS